MKYAPLLFFAIVATIVFASIVNPFTPSMKIGVFDPRVVMRLGAPGASQAGDGVAATTSTNGKHRSGATVVCTVTSRPVVTRHNAQNHGARIALVHDRAAPITLPADTLAAVGREFGTDVILSMDDLRWYGPEVRTVDVTNRIVESLLAERRNERATVSDPGGAVGRGAELNRQ